MLDSAYFFVGYIVEVCFFRKKSPNEACKIAENWKKYAKKQNARLANSRKMRNREKIAELMEQIDRKLANN
jgi:hypothetical protein